jgi:subtilase family serine protease
MPFADLLLQNLFLPTSVTIGSSFQFSYQVKNQGDATAATNYTTFYLSTDSTFSSNDLLLGSDYVSSIGIGGISSESASLTIGSSITAGNYFLLCRADGYGYVTESNENNNIVARAITVTSPSTSDLIIQNASAPISASAGSIFQVSYELKNQGTGSAGSSYTKFYLSKDATLSSDDLYLSGSDHFFSSLGGGSLISRTASVQSNIDTAPGNYYLLFQADGAGSVAETNENNNVVAKAITVTTALRPDLVVNYVGGINRLAAGSTISFNYQINNQGNGFAGSNTAQFYLSNDATLSSDDVFLGSNNITSLSAGTNSGTLSSSAIISSSTAAGNYYLLLQADSGGLVTESNETNNITPTSITITKPDLIIENPLAPTSAVAGSSIQLSYQIKNQGNATAAESYTRFYLSNDTTFSSDDVSLGSDYVPQLLAGGISSESYSANIGANINAGNYYLLYRADIYNYVLESNETNNIFASPISITIPQPDLVVENALAPVSAIIGSSIQLDYQINNSGNATAGSSNTNFYLSNDSIFSSDDLLLGSDTVISLGIGGSSSQSSFVNIDSSISAGDYYLLYQADASGLVVESNEINNFATRAISLSSI